MTRTTFSNQKFMTKDDFKLGHIESLNSVNNSFLKLSKLSDRELNSKPVGQESFRSTSNFAKSYQRT